MGQGGADPRQQRLGTGTVQAQPAPERHGQDCSSDDVPLEESVIQYNDVTTVSRSAGRGGDQAVVMLMVGWR